MQILSRLTEFGFPPSDSKQIAEWVGARIKSGRSITKDHRLLITRKPFQLEVIGAPAPTVTGLGDYFYQEFEGENQVRHGVEHMYQNLFSREDANELIKLNLPFGAMVVKTMNTLRKLSGDEKPE